MKKAFITTLGIFFILSGTLTAANLIANDHDHNDNSVVSHSGGTDAYGCHNDHKRGGYHCH